MHILNQLLNPEPPKPAPVQTDPPVDAVVEYVVQVGVVEVVSKVAVAQVLPCEKASKVVKRKKRNTKLRNMKEIKNNFSND